jgi:glutamine synthetase
VTPKEVLALIREKEVKAVDLRFMDFPGTWKHFTIPAEQLEEITFEEGRGFSGSSIHGWKAINESDILVVPAADTAFVDPFCRNTTLTLICNIQDPLTREDYPRDPRNVARKAVNYMNATGIADVANFGSELEFFLVDDVRFGQSPNSAHYRVDGGGGADATNDLRTEMMLTMAQCGLLVERQHHEAATGGQAEIAVKYDTLIRAADNVQKFKYIVKNVAKRHGKSATFMPKLTPEKECGMHVHVSLWKDDRNLFAGTGYAGLSDTAIYAIGGLLRHAAALCGITNPATNSYRRLVAGTEAPVNLAYSARNRSAAVRIPVYSPRAQAKRIEFRCPDGASNPYLAFAAVLMAILDGVKNKIHPGEALDKDIYDLAPEELTRVPKTPGSLAEALNQLERDHEFLLQGDVFTEDVIDTWIWFKRNYEVDALRLRPHPYEFTLYYDV